MQKSIFILVIVIALISPGFTHEWTAEEMDNWEDNCYYD